MGLLAGPISSLTRFREGPSTQLAGPWIVPSKPCPVTSCATLPVPSLRLHQANGPAASSPSGADCAPGAAARDATPLTRRRAAPSTAAEWQVASVELRWISRLISSPAVLQGFSWRDMRCAGGHYGL